jgi:sigma-B regulation protein RsbQ
MDIRKRNNVSVFGHGSKPMIFAHGFGCGQNMWRYIWPAFENDYQIILFDYVGSGNSDVNAYNSERYGDLYGYAQDVIDICEELNLTQAVFVGHSVSSMVGVLASIKRPELFDKLIMVSPSARYINDQGYIGGFDKSDIEELLSTMEKNYIGWANFLAPVIMQNDDRPELGNELNESFCSTDPVIARQFAEVTFLSDNRKDLGKVRHPSLILQCSKDLIAPTEVGQYLQDHLRGSTQKVMEATGHCPHLSSPEETVKLMKEFLAQTSASF